VVSIAGMPAPETAAEIGKGGFMAFLFRIASRKQLRLAKKTKSSYRYVFMRPDGAQLAEIAKLIDSGEVRATIDRVLPLSEWKTAFEMQESGKTRGKLVLAIG
jgi:alcohol dehydrogenase